MVAGDEADDVGLGVADTFVGDDGKGCSDVLFVLGDGLVTLGAEAQQPDRKLAKARLTSP
jgi:hypothetical protein